MSNYIEPSVVAEHSNYLYYFLPRLSIFEYVPLSSEILLLVFFLAAGSVNGACMHQFWKMGKYR